MLALATRGRLAALLIGVPVAAGAAPVFPGASRVGLVPPPGMTASRTFDGFEAGNASIVIDALPKQAFARINESRDTFVTRLGAKHADDVDIDGVHGFMVTGQQLGGPVRFRKWVVVLDGHEETAVVSAQVPVDDAAISDTQVATALRSIVFRPRPGLDQRVAALPFSVGDLAGFRISGDAVGTALTLVDAAADGDPAASQAHVVVAANAGAAPRHDRAVFANGQLQSFQAVHTSDIRSTKLFDAEGTQWAEVDATGTEGAHDTPVAITLFVRFEAGRSYSVFCIAPRTEAARYADRFKTVALSVTPKA